MQERDAPLRISKADSKTVHTRDVCHSVLQVGTRSWTARVRWLASSAQAGRCGCSQPSRARPAGSLLSNLYQGAASWLMVVKPDGGADADVTAAAAAPLSVPTKG